MPRLDVHPMPRKGEGYVVDVQADLLYHLATRTVVPLLPEATAPKPISELNPIFEIQNRRCVLVTQAIASIPQTRIEGRCRIAFRVSRAHHPCAGHFADRDLIMPVMK